MKSAHFIRRSLGIGGKGFTLVELLIVIAIIGVLAVVVLVAINPAEKLRQARDSGRKSDISQIATALEAYYTGRSPSEYPSGNGCGTGGLTTLTTYQELRQLPKDPKTGWCYGYAVDASSRQTAGVYATLEAQSASREANGPGTVNSSYFCWLSTTGQGTVTTALAAGTCFP